MSWLNSLGVEKEKEFLRPLRGKDFLLCWCSLSVPCHVDNLVQRINDFEAVGLFDKTLEELRLENAKRSILLVRKAMDLNREFKAQTHLEEFLTGPLISQ